MTPFTWGMPEPDAMGAYRHMAYMTAAVTASARIHPARGQDIFPFQCWNEESIIHKNTDLLRFSQKKAEETDGKAAQYACKDPFYEQAEPEFVPVVQSHVGPKQLPVK